MTVGKKKKAIGDKPNNFIFQAGILAAAGIIVHIIGILYRSPLVMIIGDEGNGYYNTAYNIYMIILFVSSYSIPAAMSKVIAARLSVGENHNAYRLFIGSIVYVLVLGGLGSIFCATEAGRLVGPSSAEVLVYFSPTILLSGLLGTFRGFFQAHHTMVYTSFSQILEQITNAVVSIGAAYLFVRSLAGRSETEIAIGGAKGSALGTGAGVLVALIFMLIIYMRDRRNIHDRVSADAMSEEYLLTPGRIAIVIFSMVTPVILSTCIYNLSTPANLKIYQGIVMRYKGYSEAMATTNYGLYSGKAMQMINIPIAIATAVSLAILPSVSHSHERGEYKEERDKIAYAIRVTMLIAIPSAFGLFAVAEPVILLFYPQRATYQTVAHLIMALSITVIFSCISTLGNAILQGTGYAGIPVVNSAIALVTQAAVLVVLLRFTKLDLYALCIAMVINSFMMCVLNLHAIRRRLGYRQEYMKTFVLPVAASIVMCVVAAGSNHIVSSLIRAHAGDPDMIITGVNNLIRLIVSIVLAVITYMLLTLKLDIIGERELKLLPKGAAIARILKRLRLLK